MADIVLPVFYATSFENGGLDLPPQTVGSVLGTWGLLNGIFQVRPHTLCSECIPGANPMFY